MPPGEWPTLLQNTSSESMALGGEMRETIRGIERGYWGEIPIEDDKVPTTKAARKASPL